MAMADAERVHPDTVEEWRAWLDEHHAIQRRRLAGVLEEAHRPVDGGLRGRRDRGTGRGLGGQQGPAPRRRPDDALVHPRAVRRAAGPAPTSSASSGCTPRAGWARPGRRRSTPRRRTAPGRCWTTWRTWSSPRTWRRSSSSTRGGRAVGGAAPLGQACGPGVDRADRRSVRRRPHPRRARIDPRTAEKTSRGRAGSPVIRGSASVVRAAHDAVVAQRGRPWSPWRTARPHRDHRGDGT